MDGFYSCGTGLDLSASYVPYVESCLLTFSVSQYLSFRCMSPHTHLLFALCLSTYLYIQGKKALLRLLYPYFSLVRQPSLACLLHCSVSVVPSCMRSTWFVNTSMLSWTSYGKYQLRQGAVSCIFNVKRVFHQISPTIFWSENWISVHRLQISPACLMHFDCLKGLWILLCLTNLTTW